MAIDLDQAVSLLNFFFFNSNKKFCKTLTSSLYLVSAPIRPYQLLLYFAFFSTFPTLAPPLPPPILSFAATFLFNVSLPSSLAASYPPPLSAPFLFFSFLPPLPPSLLFLYHSTFRHIVSVGQNEFDHGRAMEEKAIALGIWIYIRVFNYHQVVQNSTHVRTHFISFLTTIDISTSVALPSCNIQWLLGVTRGSADLYSYSSIITCTQLSFALDILKEVENKFHVHLYITD